MKQSLLIFTLLVLLLAVGPVRAYVASSNNYKLEKDSINFAGVRSTSASYVMEDTLGEVGTGTSTSASYSIHAGYQAMESSGVSISMTLSSPSDVTMSPAIGSVAGGESNGSAVWTVTTNNFNGYSLSVKSSTDPALQSGSDSFTNYNPTSGGADFSFEVGSTEAKFGFSPEGSDILSTYKDNGSQCGTGSSDTSGACWNGFDTVGKTIATKSSSNSPSGTAITLKLKALAGGSANKTKGSYNAVITATAITL